MELLANKLSPPTGNGGSYMWERAKRFVGLKLKYRLNASAPEDLFNEIFDIDNWSVSEPEELESATLDMRLVQQKVAEIFEEVKNNKPELSGDKILQLVAKILRYQVATKEPFVDDEKANIRITTFWGAKGVTADHVYALGLCKEAVPGERRPEYPGTDLEYVEEQRRLFYVSITRSKKTLVLSRALKIQKTEADRLGLVVRNPSRLWPTLEMSPFLQDIMNFLPDAQNGDSWKGVN